MRKVESQLQNQNARLLLVQSLVRYSPPFANREADFGNARPSAAIVGRERAAISALSWRRWHTCRDFAVLFTEAVRSLGFGARMVSGYLFNPDQTLIGSSDDGSTHAWAEVFIPGAGWITFDSTNRSMGGANLIPVAVIRDIAHAVPVSGSFVGPSGSFVSLDVAVEVKAM